MANRIRIWKMGIINYKLGEKLQQILAKNVLSGADDSMIILQHPPVYTIGIRTKGYSEDDEKKLVNLGAEFQRTNRGGLITFHGPGQLVAYPVLDLRHYNLGLRKYVNNIEQVAIKTCAQFNIKAETCEHTGVWVGENKICAIGLHASRYITSHGLALNCNTDLKWFEHIVPCGIEGRGVTSISKELNKTSCVDDVIPYFLKSFCEVFNCETVDFEYCEAEDILNNVL